MKTKQDVIDAGGIEFRHDTGSTWNDGGAWNTWFYRMPDGGFMMVHQPTDYRNEVVVEKVVARLQTEIVFETEDGF